MVAHKKLSAPRVKRKPIAVAKAKTVATKPHAVAAPSATATIDRREPSDRRATGERRTQSVPVPVERRAIERRVKVNRRRQIDPTTCERDYTPHEIEFMAAMDAYKRRSGRMFPTCSEVLEVVSSLGYEKRTPAATDAAPGINLAVAAIVESPAFNSCP